MEAKEFYETLFAVAKFIERGNNAVSEDEGKGLAGAYWPRVSSLLVKEKVGTMRLGGVLAVTNPSLIPSILADCHHAFKELAKSEAGRELDNAMKLSAMKYAKRAFWISIISIIIAVAAFGWQVVTRIWP